MVGRIKSKSGGNPEMGESSAVKVCLKGSTFEQRAKYKEIKKAYKERMTELKDRKKREEREKRKQEIILKSGTKLQIITNPKDP